MTVRGLQLRAILIPVGVAAFLIAALSWYGLVWIPAQQRYLNERNIRLLRIISAQIQSRVNNFDQAIDHALESFAFKNDQSKQEVYGKAFQEYVKLFAPDLEIAEASELPISKEKDLFSDPPRVKILLDEGKHYVYLFYAHEVEGRKGKKRVVKVSARADIEQVVGDYLSKQSEFDALALVDFKGRVIAQHSSSGVKLVRLDRLTGAAPARVSTGSTRESSPKRNETPADVLETLRTTGNITPVTIGGAAYWLYVQPVQLSLLREAGIEAEEWGLCGLVRVDHFRAASSAISPTYWLMLIAALAVLCLVIPLLKVQVLSPRERFHRSDGVWVAAATFLIAALLTFGLLDVYHFGYAFKNNIDGRLRDLAAEIQANLREEARAARKELDELDGKRKDREFQNLIADKNAEDQLQSCKQDEETRLQTDSRVPCRQSLLAKILKENLPYPYFNLMAWTNLDGKQKIKWTTRKVITPFINIRDHAYYNDLDRALRLGPTSGAPQSGISVIRSQNTSEPLTVFWKALPPGGLSDLRAASLTTTPLSVVQPVLPKGMQFAVLDVTGQVLFHSDPTRSLNENFFQECEDNPTLRALVLGRTSDTVTAEYLGRRHRLFVTPINLAIDDPSFRDPQWSLVVFQDRLLAETVNLETLTIAAALFAAYGLVLAGGWGLIYLIWPRYTVKWFWPHDEKGGRYRWAALLNGSLSLAFVGLIAGASPEWLLFRSAFISMGALVAAFAIVRLSNLPMSPRKGWQNDFVLARVLLLFAVAAVPAIACFQVAYDFEASLLNRRAQLHLTNELKTRTERVEKEMRLVGLCEDENNCSKDPNVEAFRKRRLGETLDVDILTFTPAGGPVGLSLETHWLDRLLAFAHVGYNDVATDLKTGLPGVERPGQEPARHWKMNASGEIDPKETVLASMAPSIHADFWSWLIAAAVALGLFLLVRLAVRPLFLLDLYGPPGLKSSGNRDRTGNLLLVGPPGSGKTEALRNESGICVFDVRSLAYVPNSACQRPMKAPGFPPEARPQPSGSWPDAMEFPTLTDGVMLGIDHLEYRFDDPSFRDRLLTFLEDLLYRRRCQVWIASTREPLDQLRESGATVNLDRWRLLFQSFRLEIVGITSRPDPEPVAEISRLVQERTGVKPSDLEKLIFAECSFAPELLSIAKDFVGRLPRKTTPTDENVWFEIGVAAEPFYRAVWSACSKDEKVVLRQLAEEGVVNPRNRAVVAQLLRRGLVRRDPTFQVMNETFRRFVVHELRFDELAAWEHEGLSLPWGSIATTMLTMALGLIGLLLLTQQQLVDAWIGYVPALAPAVPTVMKLIAGVQHGAKPGTAPV